jgi:hypothetical protein
MASKADSSERATRRSRRKITVLGLLALVSVSIVGFYFYQRWSGEARLREAIEEADRLDPDWRIVDLEAHRKEVPDAENGVLQALEARRLFPDRLFPWEPLEPADGSGPMALPRDPPVQPRDEQVQRIRSELQRARAALTTARKLADMPQGRQHLTWEPDYARRIWLTLPTPYIGQDLIQVANLLGYDALLQAQDGDLARALRSTRALLNTGRCIGDEPSADSQAPRMTIQSRAWTKAERVLAQGEPRPIDLERTQRAFEEEAEEPVLYFALRGDRGILDDVLKDVQAGAIPFKIVRRYVSELKRDGGNQLEENLDTLGFILNVRNERSQLLRFMNRAVEIATTSPDRQAARMQELEADSLKDRPTLMVKSQAQATRKRAEVADRLRAQLHCAALALAAERYRQARSQWPASLTDLVPDYVARIPHDPFDGRPLKLARHAQGITIYSVGVDGVDNGGTINIRRIPSAPGVDLGFRLWDLNYRRQPAKPLERPEAP